MHRRLLVASFVLVTGLVGCSDDDDTADPTDASPTEATEATDATDELDADDDGAPGGAFCGVAEDYAAVLAGEAFTIDNADPATIEAATSDLRAQLDALDDTAPDAINDDLDLIIDGTEDFLDALEDADYDVAVLTAQPEFAELSAEFGSARYLEATDRVAGYVQDECGIDLDGAEEPVGVDATTVSSSDG